MKAVEFAGAVAISMLLISGCNYSTSSSDQGGETGSVVDIDSYASSVLTQELKDSLAYMGNEERLAYDVYNHLYLFHSANGEEIQQLHNIASRSEIRHIQTVQALVNRYDLNANDLTEVTLPIVSNTKIDVEEMPAGKYDIPAIQNLYDALVIKGEESKQDALEVGCMVEVTDINDLDAYILQAQAANATDVEAAFVALRDGSYNHYWAFDKGLKNMGVSTGCCSLGTLDGVNYCHTEYPKNDNGGGRKHTGKN